MVTPLSVMERKVANLALSKQLSPRRMVWEMRGFVWISLSREPAYEPARIAVKIRTISQVTMAKIEIIMSF